MDWTYIERSEEAQDVFWTSYVRLMSYVHVQGAFLDII